MDNEVDDIKDQLNSHMDKLENFACEESKFNEDDAWKAAVKFGFVRRYVDAANKYTDEELEREEIYMPEGADERLDDLFDTLGRLDVLDWLPSIHELTVTLRRMATGVLQEHFDGSLVEGNGDSIEEAIVVPFDLEERAERPREVLQEADEILSVARTVQEFGVEIPPAIYGRSVDIAQRLYTVLDDKVLEFVQHWAECQSIERLLIVDEFGRFLWTPIWAPETLSMRLREVGRKVKGG